MKYLLAIMISIFLINPTVTYSQTDAEIEALMLKLEQLKKKKAEEEKAGKVETNKSGSESLQTENSSKTASVFTATSATSEELNIRLKKIEMRIARSKYLKDSVNMINDFERDSAANAIMALKGASHILIDNNEVDSVFIDVDGKTTEKVKVPYLVENLKEGWHKVVVKNDWGYVDYKEGLFLGDSVYSLTFDAGIPRNSISINSTPKQAKISINDSVVGFSPVTVEGLKPGEYSIKMEINGFSTYETKFELNGMFSPKIYAELNEEIPDSYKPIYSEPRKIAGAALGVTALVTGIVGIISHSTSNDYEDQAAANKAQFDEYRLEGNKEAAADELAKEQSNNESAAESQDTGNTLLMISFVTLSFSVPLLTF